MTEQKLSILIVEDEFLTRRHLKKKLQGFGYSVILESGNIDHAIEILEEEVVDMAILDINLGDKAKDGIWLGEYIRVNQKIPFLYLTAYQTEDIIDRAINTRPESYLTKPFSDLSLKTTIALVAQKCSFSEKKIEVLTDYLTVKDGDYFKKLDINDVSILESEGNYLIVRTEHHEYRYRTTIKKVMEVLPTDKFIQVHRAFIVQKKYVSKFNATTLWLGELEIPISQSKRKEVLGEFSALKDNM